MVQPIINTGERILLEKETPLMIARHLRAYKFAHTYCMGKKVLDFGCGEGYGAHFLSQVAKDVTGVDYDEEIIRYASDKYKKQNLQFLTADAKKESFTNDTFEVICNFQVIEHIEDTDLFLKNIGRMLQKSGIFICSTPNKLDASPRSKTPLNKFHVKEYFFEEFKGLLQGYFSQVEVYGVKRDRTLSYYRRLKKIGIFNFLPEKVNPVKNFYCRINCDNFLINKDNINNALDFIAVCKK